MYYLSKYDILSIEIIKNCLDTITLNKSARSYLTLIQKCMPDKLLEGWQRKKCRLRAVLFFLTGPPINSLGMHFCLSIKKVIFPQFFSP